MAEALWRLRGGRTRLLTALGDDDDGRYLDRIAPGLLLDGCIVEGSRTASYSAVLDSQGACLLGLGDMDVHAQITPQMVDKHLEVLANAPLVVLDGNVPQVTVDHVIKMCKQFNIPIFLEPTDRRKATKALRSNHRLTYSTPNLSELIAMAKFLNPNIIVKDNISIDEIIYLTETVSKVVDYLIVTLDIRGVLVHTTEDRIVHLYPVERLNSIESASGAGDCFASGFIYGILLGYHLSECVSIAFESAKCALLSRKCVPSKFFINLSDIKKAQFKDLS